MKATYQNTWDMKVVLQGKFTSKTFLLIDFSVNQKKTQVNNVIIHLKVLEKQEQTKAQNIRERKNNKD